MILANLRGRADLQLGSGGPRIDCRGLTLLPGFVDLHCHLREPGLEHKETIRTGTAAAAAGGFTTVCCMPNTEPAIDTLATLRLVQDTARSQGAVRVLPIAAVTRGRAGSELTDMAELAGAGAVAFSDDGSPVADSRLMRLALEYAASFGRPVIDHCEDPRLTAGGAMHEGAVSERLGLPGWPTAGEEVMVARDIALAAQTGAHVHLAHLSTAPAVELVRAAKRRGIRVTTEVTPHHLTLTDAWVERGGYDTNCKVNPPLRTDADRAALLEGLIDGTIDAIATDHAPHARVEKECEFESAAFGISNLETAFGSLMGLVHTGQLPFEVLVDKLTRGPAAVLGLSLPEDDWTLVDPDAEWMVDVDRFRSRGRNSPLHGQRLTGRVLLTVCRGVVAFDGLSEAVAA
ncbi:MAG TPA: dihydroorotase [Chloroflexota bacterium]|nr:dihydroorotase [Chloroflexota bacterium]